MATSKDEDIKFFPKTIVVLRLAMIFVGVVTTLYWAPTVAEVVLRPWTQEPASNRITISSHSNCDLTLAWTTEAQKEPVHYHTAEDQRSGTTTLLSAPKSDRYVLEVQNPCGDNLRFNLKR